MEKTAITELFAAANGFGGFRSYFDDIFNRKDYSRVFILKGGPGTGKSTVMKKVLDKFRDKCFVQSIRCSSDPNSLDGVTITSGEIRVAIIDGTSPHEEDAYFPGAVDEIINLGEAWNESILVKHRGEIVSLCELKKKHYRSAYDLLDIAGSIFDKESNLTSSIYVGNDESLIANEIPKIANKKSGRHKHVALLSSFSARGLTRLEANASETVSVSGRYGSEYIFLDHFAKAISLSGHEHTVLHSPFSESLVEGIYLHATDTLYLANAGNGRVINTCRFLDDTALQYNEALYSLYGRCRAEILDASKHEFQNASDAHFKLERIYSKSIDFDTVNRITESLINEINYLFCN